MKKENILAVTKLGVDYGWFTLVTLQSKTQNLIWEIEELKEKLELKLAE